MPRLMSCSETTQQVRDRTKTVTRRLGWWEDKNGRRLLKVGDRLTLCEQVMGRPLIVCPQCRGNSGGQQVPCETCGDRGAVRAPLVRLAEVEVVSIRREPLTEVDCCDAVREGFPHLDGYGFVDFFCKTFGVPWHVDVTRIEWRYLDDVTVPDDCGPADWELRGEG